MSVLGKNTEYIHSGQRFHIQTESWAPEEMVLVTQVFQGGQLVLKKKHPVLNRGSFTEEDVLKAHEKAIEDLKGMLI